MKNLFISNLNKKDADKFTSDIGLMIRRTTDVPFKKLCNTFTKANIIRPEIDTSLSDEEYFEALSNSKIPLSTYDLQEGKNNIILERYPQLEKNESYIFVCNHTCPEDIETILNVIDRNAYLVLGSIESLKYNPEMYLLWLNGMIPFDILDDKERKDLPNKMKRVLKTNSIAIFPEGSHNYHPNKIINNLFDGTVNLALETGKKIVLTTLVRDNENNVSYIDVSNPIDLSTIQINVEDYCPNEKMGSKGLVKAYSSYIRDKMATAVYHIIERHSEQLKREDYTDIEKYLRQQNIENAFSKLKWSHDVFEAEYLVKKTKEEKDYEDVINTLSNLRLNKDTLRTTGLDSRPYILKKLDLENKNVARYMKEHWIKTQNSQKVMVKK